MVERVTDLLLAGNRVLSGKDGRDVDGRKGNNNLRNGVHSLLLLLLLCLLVRISAVTLTTTTSASALLATVVLSTSMVALSLELILVTSLVSGLVLLIVVEVMALIGMLAMRGIAIILLLLEPVDHLLTATLLSLSHQVLLGNPEFNSKRLSTKLGGLVPLANGFLGAFNIFIEDEVLVVSRVS